VRPNEYGAVAELTLRAYLGGVGASDPYRARLADVAGRAASSEVLVALDDAGIPIGTVTYVAGPGTAESEFDDPEAAGMRMLAVEPSLQGRGVGRALARACVERALRDGRRRLIIHARREMAAARRIYETSGFERDSSGDFEPLPGVDLVCYVLELGESVSGADTTG